MKLLMSLIVFIGVIFFVESSPTADYTPLQNLIAQVISGCKEEMKPTEDDLTILRNRKVPTTESGKCFCGCMASKFQYWKDGAYQKDVLEGRIRAVFPNSPEKIEESFTVLRKCEEKFTPNDKCEFGFQLFDCFSKMVHLPNMDW